MEEMDLNKITDSLKNLNVNKEKPFYKKGDFIISLIIGTATALLSIIAMIQTNIYIFLENNHHLIFIIKYIF